MYRPAWSLDDGLFAYLFVFGQPVTFLSIASLCVGFCVGLGLL